MELLAIEYRPEDFSTSEEFEGRLQQLTKGFADHGIGAVGLPSLMLGRPFSGTPVPSTEEKKSQGLFERALLWGLRTEDPRALEIFANTLSPWGYTGLVGWTGSSPIPLGEQIWSGFGLLFAGGADQAILTARPGTLRKELHKITHSIAMPGPALDGPWRDGLLQEEARRQQIQLLWLPGSGVNLGTDEGPQILTALHDDGTRDLEELFQWALGDPLQRGKLQLREIGHLARRFFFARMKRQG